MLVHVNEDGDLAWQHNTTRTGGSGPLYEVQAKKRGSFNINIFKTLIHLSNTRMLSTWLYTTRIALHSMSEDSCPASPRARE